MGDAIHRTRPQDEAPATKPLPRRGNSRSESRRKSLRPQREGRTCLVVGGVFALIIVAANATGALGLFVWGVLMGNGDPFPSDEKRLVVIVALIGFALGMAHQLGRSVQAGFVYCGATDTVARTEDPALYRLYLVLHIGFVLFAALWALNALFWPSS